LILLIDQVKQKELQNSDVQIKAYKREIANLKLRYKDKAGYEKVSELEDKLNKNYEVTRDLQKRIVLLNYKQKVQGKELEHLIIDQKYENKILILNEELKRYKDKYKELNNKLVISDNANKKTKEYWQTLNEKVGKLKVEPHKVPIVKQIQDTSNLKKEVEELKLQLERERNANKKQIQEVLAQVHNLSQRAKQLTLINKINSYNIKGLSRISITKVNSKKTLRNSENRRNTSVIKKRNKNILNTVFKLK